MYDIATIAACTLAVLSLVLLFMLVFSIKETNHWMDLTMTNRNLIDENKEWYDKELNALKLRYVKDRRDLLVKLGMAKYVFDKTTGEARWDQSKLDAALKESVT